MVTVPRSLGARLTKDVQAVRAVTSCLHHVLEAELHQHSMLQLKTRVCMRDWA